MRNYLFVFGTRPEAIKMAPLIRGMNRLKDACIVKICITAQHRELLDQVMLFFGLQADYDLDVMKPDQSLFDITAAGLQKLAPVLEECKPDMVFVQGDTTTAFIGALAAYYKKIKIAHLEAGLRSGELTSPFPEEANRRMISHLADFHFAPTMKAKDNLEKENIHENIFVVGNTVIDALFQGMEIIREQGEKTFYDYFHYLDFNRKLIVVTGHRRESFGKPFENICSALKTIAGKYHDLQIVYPMHLNPNVREPVTGMLKDIPNIFLIEPLEYPHMIWLMRKSHFIITDSGGIQEEAPSLGKPVLVMRDVTERMESVEAGSAIIVGTDCGKIVKEADTLLTDTQAYAKMSRATSPYGDGKAVEKIIRIVCSPHTPISPS